jgi:hypothetical protein
MKPVILRSIAILIAIAGAIDPGFTAERRSEPHLVAIDLTSGASDVVVAELQAAAAGWRVSSRRDPGPRLPCGLDERCVIVADGSIDADIPRDLGAPVSVIAVRRAGSPNVMLRSAATGTVSSAAAAVVKVELTRTGAVAETAIRISDGTAVVGSATHTWTDSNTASIDVPWWPMASGARALTVEAVPFDGESTVFDNTIDLGVAVDDGQMRVLVFDARPSWNSTFIRRSLEDDPRFRVEYRSRLAPSLTAGTAGGRLDAGALESSAAVVIGGPDALTAGDVTLLDRYVAVRGGSLILLPEQRVSGAAARLFGDGWTERLVPTAESIGPLRAGEILQTVEVPVGSAVLARAGESPSIVALPSGQGRVIISGAMDAWRYRHLDAGAFERFWRSVVANAAAAGAPLRVDLGATLAARTDRVPFSVRRRSLEPRASSSAAVTVTCSDGAATSVRAWPSGTIGEFAGELPAAAGDRCSVRAIVDGDSATTSYAVAARVRAGVDATLAKLERQARATGGVFAIAGDPASSLSAGETIARALRAQSADSSLIVTMYPMRSAWWILPFAGCLSIEWWLRRRAGLR